MQYYVDILSGTTKQGGGPLIAVLDWTVTRRIDRAGSFSFTIPAVADVDGIVVAKRTANIYAHMADTYTYIGGGIIDRIEHILNTDGTVTLRASGDDDLRELTYRSVLDTVTQVTDSADTWSWRAKLGSATGVNDMATDGAVLVAGGNDGYIYRSTDGGLTWSTVTRLGTSNNVLKVYYDTYYSAFYASDSTNNHIYAGYSSGTWWTRPSASNDFAFQAAPCRWNTDAVWLMSTRTTGTSNIYRRAAAGWSSVLSTWTDEGAMGSATLTRCIIWVSSAIAVAGCDDGHIYRSTDSGSTWTDEGQLGSTTAVLSLATDGSGVVLAGADGHVFRSTDNGANWSDTGQLGSELGVWCFTQIATDIFLAGTGSSGKIYRSEDNGATWSYVADLDSESDVLSLLNIGNGFAYAGTGAGGNIYSGEPSVTATTHPEAVQMLEDLSPSWTFVPDSAKASNTVFIQFAGETLLAAALLVADRSETHCYLSGAKEITFESVWTSSGVHAITPQLGNVMDATTAALLEMVVTSETYDIVTRVYPYGKTSAGARLGIATSTISAPSGTTVDKTANYVQHTAGESTYGRIERWITFDDIIATTTDTTVAADTLVKSAALMLGKTTTPITNYRVTLGGCATLLTPMQTIRITYQGDLRIDETLNILETTWKGDVAGMATVSAIISDGTYWIQDDAENISASMARVDRLAAR